MEVKDEDHQLLISQVIGYMLKVIKSGKNISEFKNEFNAIKHGDYDEFMDIIQEPGEFMVQYSYGVVKTEGFSKKSGDCDYTMIFNSENAVRSFGDKCFAEYGKITDPDISDLLFCRCAAFEISLRNHVNNHREVNGIAWTKRNLNAVIDEICEFKNIPQDEKDILHGGRKFLNTVKSHKKQFDTWQEGINAFNKAWEVRNNHIIKLI